MAEAQKVSEAAQEQMVLVIPANAKPGQTIQMRTPCGQTIQVQIPPNMKAGMEMIINYNSKIEVNEEEATSKKKEENNELKNWGTKQTEATKVMTMGEKDEMKNWGRNESKQPTSKTKVMPVSIASDEEIEETQEDASTTKQKAVFLKMSGNQLQPRL